MKIVVPEPLFETLRGFQLYVGFSGGADSTALLLLAHEASLRYQCQVAAVHFNHHLRGKESDAEAADAKKFAADRNIPFLLFDLDCGSGTEAEAREARLAVWKRLAADCPRSAVLLGHHADDRAENLLLRLARGSNASGATALRSSSVVAGVRFIRPLLDHHRSEIEDFLRERGISTWAQDSSNFQDHARRNEVRMKLLPALYRIFPEAVGGLQRSLDALECDARLLEEIADKTYLDGDPRQRSFWSACPEATGFRCFRRFCSELAGEEMLPDRAGWKRFRRMIARGECGRLPLSGNLTLKLDAHWVSQYKDAETPETVLWDWQSVPQIVCGKWLFRAVKGSQVPEKTGLDQACFDAEEVSCPLLLTPAKGGETMIPFGRDSEEKVKKLRIDRGVAPEDLPPLLKNGQNEILWVPQVRHSALHPARQNRDVVLFSVEKRKNHL